MKTSFGRQLTVTVRAAVIIKEASGGKVVAVAAISIPSSLQLSQEQEQDRMVKDKG